MAKKKILVCDDQLEASEEWTARLKAIPLVAKSFEVKSCEPGTLQAQVESLADRRKQVRSEGCWSGDHHFDDLDILVVDYDLQDEDPRSGREIAYLARCFSRCGLIVTLNESGRNPFDLTLVSGLESFADLNIGSEQLSNRGLWQESWKGFRPWAWPLIPAALKAFNKRAKAVQADLDKKVLDYFHFTADVLPHIPRAVLQFLAAGKKKPEDVTFRDFVADSPSCLQAKDRHAEWPDDVLARIAAARLGHWLERSVLPGQNILVDAPHLAARFASLLEKQPPRAATLNTTATLDIASKSGLRYRQLRLHQFVSQDWISRACWYWPKVADDKSVAEVADPWSAASVDQVFCEDVSRFLPAGAAREFVAEVDSSFSRRFVANPNAKEVRKFAEELRAVAYNPIVRLSL